MVTNVMEEPEFVEVVSTVTPSLMEIMNDDKIMKALNDISADIQDPIMHIQALQAKIVAKVMENPELVKKQNLLLPKMMELTQNSVLMNVSMENLSEEVK